MSKKQHHSIPLYSERLAQSSVTIVTGDYAAGAQVGDNYEIVSISRPGGTTSRYTLRKLSDGSAADLSGLSVGMAFVPTGCDDSENDGVSNPAFIITAFNDPADWVEIDNVDGVVQAGVGGIATVNQATPNTATTYAYSRGVVFGAVKLPENAGKTTIKNIQFYLQDSFGLSLDDSKGDFVNLIMAHTSQKPFEKWLNAVTADINVYDKGDETFYTIATADPDRAKKIAKIALTPGQLSVNSKTWPQGANLFIQLASGSFADFEKSNLDDFARKLTGRFGIIPGGAYPFNLKSEFELSKISNGQGDYLLFFLSVSGEGDGGETQKAAGRVLFDLEQEE